MRSCLIPVSALRMTSLVILELTPLQTRALTALAQAVSAISLILCLAISSALEDGPAHASFAGRIFAITSN